MFSITFSYGKLAIILFSVNSIHFLQDLKLSKMYCHKFESSSYLNFYYKKMQTS